MLQYRNEIFYIKEAKSFNDLALKLFHFQAENNKVYKKYIQNLNIDASSINQIEEIPFLPIEFFKSQKVITGDLKSEITFTSSGTTGNMTSKHFVADLSLYEKSFTQAFEQFYGEINQYCMIGLLPSYLERKGSSLIYMMNNFIDESKHPDSGFYLHNMDELVEKLNQLEQKKQKTLLVGVSYALLDLADKYPLNLNHTTVMETGGMKGMREEMIKEELHRYLCERFNIKEIHSEYGMTELLSQAYSKGNNQFKSPPWMKILVRDTYDPFSYVPTGTSGGINVIDLANIDSCCFIETKDIGRINKDHTFEILGRFDESDIRGCNLLV